MNPSNSFCILPLRKGYYVYVCIVIIMPASAVALVHFILWLQIEFQINVIHEQNIVSLFLCQILITKTGYSSQTDRCTVTRPFFCTITFYKNTLNNHESYVSLLYKSIFETELKTELKRQMYMLTILYLERILKVSCFVWFAMKSYSNLQVTSIYFVLRNAQFKMGENDALFC